MELTLNLAWLFVATVAFAWALRSPRRSARVFLALLCAVALLFPIISASDDLNANRLFNDPAAAVVLIVVLQVTFVAIERLRGQRLRAYFSATLTASDPRSPPAR